MSLRVAVPAMLGVFTLLVLVGAIWKPKPSTPQTPPPTQQFEYRPPRGYVCYRASTPITIDGKLDDAIWKDVPWSEEFVDIEGASKPKPRFRTRVKMAWDATALYIAAELEEPHVRGILTKHDSYIFHEDHDFEVFLNPEGRGHVYAELEMNARNTTWDLLLTKPYKDSGNAIDAWEIDGLKTAVHVDGTINNAADTDRGWTIEIAWPWTGLRQMVHRKVFPKVGDQLRINFSRVELDFEVVDGQYRRVKRPEANWVWSPQGIIDMHRPDTWGYIQLSDAKPGTDTFRPDPTGPARALVHRIYYAQLQHRKDHGRLAASMQALGLEGLTHESLAKPATLEVTSSWFEASAQLKNGPRVRIGADALVTVE